MEDGVHRTLTAKAGVFFVSDPVIPGLHTLMAGCSVSRTVYGKALARSIIPVE
jgi:hypothetical protein